jgi:hypothetical protein
MVTLAGRKERHWPAWLYRRTYCKLRDLPWFVADVREECCPGTFARLRRTVRPYTLCSSARLRGLYQAVNHVVPRGVPGDVVECGTARGGSAALLGLALAELHDPRRLWLFDTFEGLPAPTARDPDYDVAVGHTGGCRGDLADVRDLMDRLGLAERSRLVKGLFQETLPSCAVASIAVLHIDADWYESVMTCLDHLYDRVSPGGIIQIDDYGHWAGARLAVQEFLERRHLKTRLRYLDYTGRQFVKPVSAG